MFDEVRSEAGMESVIVLHLSAAPVFSETLRGAGLYIVCASVSAAVRF